jgi:hypothetical protein
VGLNRFASNLPSQVPIIGSAGIKISLADALALDIALDIAEEAPSDASAPRVPESEGPQPSATATVTRYPSLGREEWGRIATMCRKRRIL